MKERFGGELQDMIYIENKFCDQMSEDYYINSDYPSVMFKPDFLARG